MSQHIDPTPKQTDLNALNSKFAVNNVTITPNGNTIGGLVKVQDKLVVGYITSTGKSCTGGTYTTIGTVNLRPVDTMFFSAFSGADGSHVGMAKIQYDGKIQVYPTSAVSNVAVSFAYFTKD